MTRPKERTYEDYVTFGRDFTDHLHALQSFAVASQDMFPKTHPGMKALWRALDYLDKARSLFDDQYVKDGLYDEARPRVDEFPMYPGGGR
jgi:hypothetical protein